MDHLCNKGKKVLDSLLQDLYDLQALYIDPLGSMDSVVWTLFKILCYKGTCKSVFYEF